MRDQGYFNLRNTEMFYGYEKTIIAARPVPDPLLSFHLLFEDSYV